MQAFRFTPEIELALFKEVINVVPYNYGGKEAKDAWKEVVQNVTLACGLTQRMLPRTAKTRVEAQLKYFITENNEMLKRYASYSKCSKELNTVNNEMQV